ncbi:MAG TPA: rhomboid family intramembrane serine protease [Polyangiaceae bacterium]
MARRPVDDALPGMPRPGKVVRVALLTVASVWVAFAVGINWAHVSPSVFLLFCGNTESILHGEVWRLLTASLMHQPSESIGHVATVLLGLYFLAPSLEEHWGSARFARFLVLSGLIAYAAQMAVAAVLPASIRERLVGDYWFGGVPVVEAIAMAWASSFSEQTIRLFFVLPISGRALMFVILGTGVMYVLAVAHAPEGLIAPFGGMFAGWLLGGSTPSPLRRAWLKIRLAQIDAETRRNADARRARARSSGLKVLEGGKDAPGSDDDNPRGPDGRWLN